MVRKIPKTSTRLKVEKEPSRFDATGKTLRELSQYVEFTPALKEKFLSQLREIPNVTRACRVLGLTRRLVYNHRRDDDDFRQAWDEALEEGVEHLEEVAADRAIEKSDLLLMFMLKGAKPEKYRERHDMTTAGEKLGSPIQIVEVRLPETTGDS